MTKTNNLDKLITSGSSTCYFNMNPQVPSDEVWTKDLEKALGIKNPGEAVSFIGIKKGKKGRDYYFLDSVNKLIPFTSKVDEENYKKVYNSMISGVAYINPSSVGVNPSDFVNLDKETGPVKNRNKEFLGIINLDYMIGLEKGKIGQYFRNGAYLNKIQEKDNKNMIIPTARYKIIKNIGQGAGLISKTITDKMADYYGFPRPNPGDRVVGIAYFEDSVLGYKNKAPSAFSMVVSSTGDKMQVPPVVIDSLYFEVILGLESKTGKRVIA